MIQIDDAIVRKLVVHKVGQDNQTVMSNSFIDLSEDDMLMAFKRILLKPFASHTSTSEFKHGINLDYNVLFKLSKAIYDDEDLIERSKDIVQHLLSVSKHANIKDGDLFIAKFEDVRLGNKYYEGLGIYKFENQESYLETLKINKEVKVKLRKGLSNKKPDKACLIIFTEEPYTLLIIDNNLETEYWQDEFIRQKPKNDFVNNTNDILSITKNFITQQIPNEYEISKADQIDYLNRSVEYFKTRDNFDKNEFEQQVLSDVNLIKSFRKFNKDYKEENEIEVSDNFEISKDVVKKQSRAFKSVLKLDKNFHIYIHGDRDLIEQGVDKSGKKFYKIYYDEES